ncbi:hypothetical protein EXE43_09930 [Halorubrum sp. SS5]|nr:hypothetical protein EXE43_09930 [Halorubrum sp. SS5]
MSNMKASYELISVAQSSHINPGDTAQIEVYITGYGDIERNKLHIIHSVPDFLSDSDPGKIYLPIAGLYDDSDEMSGVASGPFVGKKELGDTGTMIHLHPSYFVEPARRRKSDELPDVLAEGSHEGLAPVQVQINSSKTTPPGDYDFTFTLSYEDDKGEVRQTQQTTSIHVNSWVERNRKTLRVIGLIVALVSVAVSALVYL